MMWFGTEPSRNSSSLVNLVTFWQSINQDSSLFCLIFSLSFWKKEKCGNWGSNSVPTPYESVALPSELFPHKMKAPGSVDRTRCLKIIAKSITVSRSTKWAKPGEGMGGDGTGPKTTEVWFEHTRHKAKWFLIILVNHFDIQPYK